MTCTGVPPTVFQQKQSADIMDMVVEVRNGLLSEREAFPLPSRLLSSVVTPPPSANSDLVRQVASMQAQLTVLSTLMSPQPTEDILTPVRLFTPLEVPSTRSSLPSNNIDPVILIPLYKKFVWNNGSQHMVPEDFQLPSVTIKTLWDMWWSGIPSEEIAPLRLLQAGDIHVRTADKVQFSRARSVASSMISIAIDLNCIRTEQDLCVMNYEQTNDVFATIYPTLSAKINGTVSPDKKKYKRRIHECLFTTVAAQLSKK